ncbi:MAG: PKD domain-containing protein [Candidatus Pseudobacter hemicellulosilyticus]|uniref:PKD domain-containing protein n=1 Tax=Candidatus Pseudobacter hemicellulosilyticus TaxID=3121375 RepID=A0AAJ6BHD3_9BACT|nr:MAG: PKD domain-containing protein [Pseudobacter sp.]
MREYLIARHAVRYVVLTSLITIFLGKGELIAQLSASFSANSVQGCAPVLVRFTDESTGNPTSWQWDLGNGTISYLQHPAATYFNPGTYAIKLTVSNGTESSTVEKVGYITVYANPTVNFSASSTTGCYPQAIKFTDASDPGSGNTVSWQWDFGDGTFSSDQNPEHTYRNAGNFNVSLRIRNSNGCEKTLTQTNYISLQEGVKADFSFSTPNNCKPPAQIKFTNRSTGTGTLTYEWQFGDGNTSTDPSPTHSYAATGSYTVKLYVRNSTGCVDSLIKTNAINIGTVTSNFSAPATICAGTPASFTNTSTPIPASAVWRFSDGTTLTDINAEKVFTTAGNYTVKLVNDFGACKDSITKPIQVLAKLSSTFSSTNNTGCSAPHTVNFTVQTPGGQATYKWLFGDGGSSTDPNPQHAYRDTGSYTVTLITFNAAGCPDTLVKKDFVKIQVPEISIENLPLEGCIPYRFKPQIKVKTIDPIASYTWYFGDGSSATGLSPLHEYTQPGTYAVRLEYTTQSGCQGTIQAKDSVKVGSKPNADFSLNPPLTCASTTVAFTDLTTGAGRIDKWLWQFGDGGSSAQKNPGHLYQDTGTFNVRLIAWSNGCADTIIKQRVVRILAPIAKFDVTMSCTSRLARGFVDRSIDAKTWFWEFGDGNTATSQSASHSYAQPGTYTVKLTVTNGSCSYTRTRQITVYNEKADFSASATEVCKGTNITLNAINSNPQNINAYTWNIMRGATMVANPSGPSVQYNFRESGFYTITLIVSDKNNCTNTLTRTDYIRVNGATANFRPASTALCPDANVAFTDLSTDDGVNAIQTWRWDFGDGTVQDFTAPPFQHTYTTPGVYTVKLTVIDGKGCSNTKSITNAVTISRPVVKFSSPDLASCIDKPVRMLNETVATSPTYEWTFGDGNSSSAVQPTHRYTAEGDYTVKLVVRDQYGCSDSMTRPAYIVIRDPVAAFTVSDNFTSCPPLVVKFTHQAKNYNKIEWFFGDGNTSLLESPQHFYTYPGTYRAKLLITSPGGCQDSAFQTIEVKGPRGTFSYDKTEGCEPTTIQFTGSTMDVARFIWDFNDGAIDETNRSTNSHEYTNRGIYLPKMILEDPQGCRVPITGKDPITIYGVDAKFTSNKQLICDEGQVSFTDASVSNDLITGYSWVFGDGSTSTVRNPTHLFNRSGSYAVALTVTTRIGCTDRVTLPVPVKVVASPDAVIQSPDGACIPAQLQFRGGLTRPDPTTPLDWRWDFGNGTTANIQDPAAITYGTAGKYTVKLIATNAEGCADTVEKTVEAYPLPPIDAGPDQTICREASTTISASGATQYSWSPSTGLNCTDCATPLASPLSDMRYYVQAKNNFGCEARDSVLITVKQPFTIQAHKGDTLCQGEVVQLFASGAELYTWYPTAGLDNPASNQPKAKPLSTVNYQVVGHDDNGCFTDTAYVPMTVYTYPVINAGEDQQVGVGYSVNLKTQVSPDVTSIKWTPANWLSCNDCPNPVATPKQSTTYTIEASNAGGCVTRDVLSLFVFCNNANLYIPNTFTPNSDGHNDVFYPRGKGVFSIRSFRIFNRWGDLVYQQSNIAANDATKGWTGLHNGQRAPQDVYIYTLEVVCENNTVFTEKGNVTLIR